MKLSESQAQLVAHMKAHPFPLIRIPGGLWTTEDLRDGNNTPPIWWGTQTVKVLERVGVLKNETNEPFWRGRFTLSDKPIEAK